MESSISSNSQYILETVAGSLFDDIRKTYTFKEVLGGGSFGTVRTGFKNSNPDKLYAIKSISTKKLSKEDLKSLMREVEIISTLDHPNIIKFHETYHDDLYFHIVMELCTGKEVFDRIIEEKNINEYRVANTIYKVINAIFYCHNKGVSHRDLKPENILYETEESNAEIKIIDFGLSKRLEKDVRMQTVLGTPFYMAPEVLNAEYTNKCDMWSIGAITYTMITGSPPFYSERSDQVYHKIKQQEVNFNKKIWNSISENCKDFISLCLTKDPNLRISAEKAIEHPWFNDILDQIHTFDKVNSEMLENLRNFSSPSRFKKLILKVLVNQLSIDDISNLREAFNAIDLNHHGTINIYELENAFKIAGINVSNEELEKIIEKADVSKNGVLDYSEFIVACINQQKLVDREKLIKAFDYFDIDNSGYICSNDIKNALLRLGRKIINDEDIDEMISEVSKNKNKISLSEFLSLFN